MLSLKNLKDLRPFMLPAVCFGIVYTYLLLWVVIPYFRYDQFQFWDAAGHFFAAWFQKNYCFPSPFGWNPFFSCGYPQDTFYGPLYHYLITLLSFPLGLPLAFKLITVGSILILPPALYYFARKFKFNSQESSLFTLLAFVPVAGLALASGGTLFSLFTVGLGANAIGFPLFLFYFGMLKEQIERIISKESPTIPPLNLLLLTLLASSIVLVHFVVSFTIFIAALILILFNLNRTTFAFAIRHFLITFLLCSFFLFPLAAFSREIGNTETILSMGFFLTMPLFLLFVLGGAAAAADNDKRLGPVYFTLLAVFAVMLFMDFGQVGLPMHAYRFIIYFLTLAMLLPVKLLFNCLQNKILKTLLTFSFFVLLGWQCAILLLPNPRLEINNNKLFLYKNYLIPYHQNLDLGKVEGRIILLENPDRFAPRATENLLARFTGNYFLKGMFGDNGNGEFIHRLSPKVVDMLRRGNTISAPQLLNVKKLLKLFQINYILSEAPIKNAEQIERISLRADRPDYYLYKIGDDKLAEVIHYMPYHTEKDWKKAVYYWFETPDPHILVKAAQLPKTTASARDNVQVIEETINPPRLKLRVEAKEAIPLLIKISAFPRWQAQADGKPLKIYQVAPAFMLVYGKGEIILEYKDAIIDQIGWVVTLAGIIWLSLGSLKGIDNFFLKSKVNAYQKRGGELNEKV